MAAGAADAATSTGAQFGGCCARALATTLALADSSATLVPIHALAAAGDGEEPQWPSAPLAASWGRLNAFAAKRGEVLLVPSSDGGLESVLLGLGDAAADDFESQQLWAFAALPSKLPAGTYQLAAGGDAAQHTQALLGWALGAYKFSRYKTGKAGGDGGQQQQPAAPPGAAKPQPLLVVPQHADVGAVRALAQAYSFVRDVITTPAEDMSPAHLQAEAEALAAAHEGARLAVTVGDELLAARYPAIHTVGRAAACPPRLLDLTWQPPGCGGERLPLVALVGKGVCFDSGGLDIKTAQGMRLMKKDMGGAALMLGLAHVIMSAKLPVALRVLVPAVENAIAGNAYRPGDVLQTRAGLTVECGNTDAEGRLILCDALWEAANGSGQTPDVLIDAATLTGAARVALGPELPAVFSSCDAAWAQLEAAAQAEGDPLWRLPLWRGYRRMLDSSVADISSTGEPGSAGSITAALFLAEFARAAPAWLHVDTAGWTMGGSKGPGRPEGGEALGLRALWRFLRQRYAAPSSAS